MCVRAGRQLWAGSKWDLKKRRRRKKKKKKKKKSSREIKREKSAWALLLKPIRE